MSTGIVQEQQPFDVAWRTIEGLKVRYAKNGHGDEKVVLFSPWPESIFAFAPVWGGLTKQFEVLALDLPGFGRSEARDDLFAPQMMGGFIAKAIESFGFTSAHAVGLDVGSPSVLFAALARPELFRSLIVGAGASTYPLAVEGSLKSMIEAEPLPLLNAVEVIGRFLGSIRGYAVPGFVRDDYLGVLRGRSLDPVCGARSRVPDRPRCPGAAPRVDQGTHRDRCRSERPLRTRSGRSASARTTAKCTPGCSRGRSLRLGGASPRVRVDCHAMGERRLSEVAAPHGPAVPCGSRRCEARVAGRLKMTRTPQLCRGRGARRQPNVHSTRRGSDRAVSNRHGARPSLAGAGRQNGTPEFSAAYAVDASLEASVLDRPLVGPDVIGRFFRATRGMYDSLAFTHESRDGGKTFLEWSGRFSGQEIGGATIVSRRDNGRI